jgi:hypothetical protein
LRTSCRSGSRRKGTLAAPANLAIMESHSSYFSRSYAPNQATQINSTPFTANARRGERGGESTFRTVLDAVVVATTRDPCRRRWLMRSTDQSCEASSLKARGFVRRPALDDDVREPAVMAQQGRGTGTPGHDGHNGRWRLGTDMASGGGEQIGVGMRDGSQGGSGVAACGSRGGIGGDGGRKGRRSWLCNRGRCVVGSSNDA